MLRGNDNRRHYDALRAAEIGKAERVGFEASLTSVTVADSWKKIASQNCTHPHIVERFVSTKTNTKLPVCVMLQSNEQGLQRSRCSA